MRTIEYTPRSTPTFLFQITDQENSGIDLDSMSVGMSIYDNGGETPTVYFIIPANNAGQPITRLIESGLIDETAQAVVRKNDLYSRRINQNTFAITLPYSLPLVADECPFQVFLFSINEISARIVGGEKDTSVVVNPSVTGYKAILIDEGTIQKKATYLPVLNIGSSPVPPPVVQPAPNPGTRSGEILV